MPDIFRQTSLAIPRLVAARRKRRGPRRSVESTERARQSSDALSARPPIQARSAVSITYKTTSSGGPFAEIREAKECVTS
jgi:hypothetical protein